MQKYSMHTDINSWEAIMAFGKYESYNENYIEYNESVDMILSDLKHMGYKDLTKDKLITLLTSDMSIGRAVRKEIMTILENTK